MNDLLSGRAIILALILCTPLHVGNGQTEFDDCGPGKSYSCFHLPNNCEDRRDCSCSVNYRHNNRSDINTDTLDMELFSRFEWVAVGFSTDNKMGRDAVVVCKIPTLGDTPIEIVLGENPNVQDRTKRLSDELQTLVTDKRGSRVGVRLKCDFSLPLTFSEGSNRYDFINNRYFLLLAGGPLMSDGWIAQHTERGSIQEAVDLLVAQDLEAGSDPREWAITIHKLLMHLTFIFFMPTGMFLSRFYKETWANIRYLKRRLWLVLHVMCMMSALIFCIFGSFLIAIVFAGNEDDFYFPLPVGDDQVYLHNFVGLTAIIFLILQTSTHWWHISDPLWNRVSELLHWFFGSMCYGLGILNIAMANEWLRAKTDCGRQYPIAGWVCIHFLFYLFMSCYVTWTDWHLGNGGWRAFFGYPLPIASYEEAPRPLFRKIVLIIFGCVSFVVAIAIAMFGGCPT